MVHTPICGSRFEELQSCSRRLAEVEHVNAHRTNREMQQMSLFEKSITEGNEKVDDPAKEGATLDGGGVAQVRALTIQQEQEEVYAAFVIYS